MTLNESQASGMGKHVCPGEQLSLSPSAHAIAVAHCSIALIKLLPQYLSNTGPTGAGVGSFAVAGLPNMPSQRVVGWEEVSSVPLGGSAGDGFDAAVSGTLAGVGTSP